MRNGNLTTTITVAFMILIIKEKGLQFEIVGENDEEYIMGYDLGGEN